jgi:fructose-1,6-bisphosphatase/inositol monophosphatase family enzyme
MDVSWPRPWLIELLGDLHLRIREVVREDLGSQSAAFLSSVAREGAGDVTFQIDVRPEEVVADLLSNPLEPLLVICEGLGRRVFPDGARDADVHWCVIIDPLDGSREIAYGKRSAWVLSGVAAARPSPTLADIVWAMQTEVPHLGQERGVVVTAARGRGAYQQTHDLSAAPDRDGKAVAPASEQAATRIAGEKQALRPSVARSVRGGFAIFADYFAGSHMLIGEIADEVLGRVLGPVKKGEAVVYNDQYLSSGGCMYLLATGKYRFFADLRPVIGEAGRTAGLCAHPYDLCTHLIASEAGAIVTDITGGPLSYPLSTEVDCGWVGYANTSIQAEMETPLASVVGDFVARHTRNQPGP